MKIPDNFSGDKGHCYQLERDQDEWSNDLSALELIHLVDHSKTEEEKGGRGEGRAQRLQETRHDQRKLSGKSETADDAQDGQNDDRIS